MPQVAVTTERYSPAGFIARFIPAAIAGGLSQLAAEVLAAHSALSTGWGKRLHNNIICGIKSTPEWETSGGDWVQLTGTEYINGAETARTPMRWRSYPSFEGGVAAVIALLKTRRYLRSWELLQAADPGYYVQLRADGWYTAPAKNVSAQCVRNLAKIRAGNLSTVVPPAPDDGFAAVLLLAGAAGVIAWGLWGLA